MEEYKQTIEEVKKVTEADPDTGLSSQEVDERRKKQGLNKFDEAPKESMIKKNSFEACRILQRSSFL